MSRITTLVADTDSPSNSNGSPLQIQTSGLQRMNSVIVFPKNLLRLILGDNLQRLK